MSERTDANMSTIRIHFMSRHVVLVNPPEMCPRSRCMSSSSGTVSADGRTGQFCMVDLVHLFFVIILPRFILLHLGDLLITTE